MKKLTLLIVFAFSLLGMSAQSVKESKRIMKVSYESSALSPNMVSLLKKHITSPEMYKQTVGLLEKHIYYYSLYVDLDNMESAYVLDSIHSQPGVAAVGQVNEVYTDNKDNFWGAEEFVGSKSHFNGNLSDIKWNATTEDKEIAGHKCIKMTTEDHKDIEAWVCTDITVNRGPGYLQHSIGLVFEASDFFSTTSIRRIDYISGSDVIRKVKQELLSMKFITIKEELSLKDNIIRTMQIDNGQ